MNKAVKINPLDNVAVALTPLAALEQVLGVTLLEPVPAGHKFALVPINIGENVVKYGFAIGCATAATQAGAWVHTHNLKTNLSEESEYTYSPVTYPLPATPPKSFQGFLRPDGSAATRNEIWVIPTVGCVNGIATRLCRENQHLVGGSLSGIFPYTHPFGCSQMGADHAQTRRLLAALTRHPNAAGVLVLSLGCENLTVAQFLEELGDYDPARVRFLVCQDSDDEIREGSALLAELSHYAKRFSRQSVGVDKLIVGMKCGGSDGLSGITANPVVGAFSDLLIAGGGSTILTEVPEMFGAEGILMNRCESEAVFQKAVQMINGFKEYYISHGQVVYENPSPGNKAGGITTLEDKSCGCVQKGGSGKIVDVLEYAHPVTKHGLNLVCGPGNDLVSTTALTAAGAQVILFTTGRGTPFGAPAPTMKLSTNTPLYQKKRDWIDFNAGTAAEGETIQETAERLFSAVLAVCSGQQTTAEVQGYREIAIFKDGVTL